MKPLNINNNVFMFEVHEALNVDLVSHITSTIMNCNINSWLAQIF